MTRTAAQARESSYELHTLGWKAFQDLCITIVGEVLGQTVESFSPSMDAGRDGAFRGQWQGTGGATLSGSFTVQCKFTSRRDAHVTLSILRDERDKAARLARAGLANNYILMTNCKVSGQREEEIRAAFLEIPGVTECLVFGEEWISNKIRENSRLRMLVPRVYGLGDLSQILDDRAYAQAEEILSSMREDLSKVVITDAYKRSARGVMEHGFVLLLGEPAAGKSTIASALALGALDNWKCSTVVIRNADDFQRHSNPNEPHQFFWVDDVFGTTQYQRSTAYEWNQVFPYVHAAIRRGARVLFTSRDYIYRAAQQDLKGTAFPLLETSQVIINVQELSTSEREQILYNHLKLGDQGVGFRRKIKPYLAGVAGSRQFLPEVARRLGNSGFTKSLVLQRESIMDFVERPLSFLVDVVRTLDVGSKAALALIFVRGGSVDSPISLGAEDEKAVELLGSSIAAVRDALGNMGGSLTKLIRVSGMARWVFRHPTIGDALAMIVAEDPELLDIYLAGASTEKLLREVICGEVDYRGARVVVPSNRYDAFIGQLDRVADRDKVLHFLSSRCDRAFLKRYVDSHVDVVHKAVSEPRSYLGAAPDASLVARLHELNLLSEKWRLEFVNAVEALAVMIPDSDFLTVARIRKVFREAEVKRIVKRVCDDLLPHYSSVVESWESNFSPEWDSPEQYFESLKEAVSGFERELSGRGMATELASEWFSEIESAIERLADSYPEPDYDDVDYEDYRMGDELLGGSESRSVFDDVDE